MLGEKVRDERVGTLRGPTNICHRRCFRCSSGAHFTLLLYLICHEPSVLKPQNCIWRSEIHNELDQAETMGSATPLPLGVCQCLFTALTSSHAVPPSSSVTKASSGACFCHSYASSLTLLFRLHFLKTCVNTQDWYIYLKDRIAKIQRSSICCFTLNDHNGHLWRG